MCRAAEPYGDNVPLLTPVFWMGVEVYNLKARGDDCNAPAPALALADENPQLFRLSGSDFHHEDDTARGGILTQQLPENDAELAALLRRGEYTLCSGNP